MTDLAAGLGVGAASATIQNLTTGKKSGKVVFSQANINRMVRTLSKMRGAALKLGQFLSIQGIHVRCTFSIPTFTRSPRGLTLVLSAVQ